MRILLLESILCLEIYVLCEMSLYEVELRLIWRIENTWVVEYENILHYKLVYITWWVRLKESKMIVWIESSMIIYMIIELTILEYLYVHDWMNWWIFETNWDNSMRLRMSWLIECWELSYMMIWACLSLGRSIEHRAGSEYTFTLINRTTLPA